MIFRLGCLIYAVSGSSLEQPPQSTVDVLGDQLIAFVHYTPTEQQLAVADLSEDDRAQALAARALFESGHRRVAFAMFRLILKRQPFKSRAYQGFFTVLGRTVTGDLDFILQVQVPVAAVAAVGSFLESIRGSVDPNDARELVRALGGRDDSSLSAAVVEDDEAIVAGGVSDVTTEPPGPVVRRRGRENDVEIREPKPNVDLDDLYS